jgi:hypothetical protein
MIDSLTGGFIGGVRTNFGSLTISTRYRMRDNIDATFETEEDDDDDTDDYQYPSVLYNNEKRPPKTFKTAGNLHAL